MIDVLALALAAWYPALLVYGPFICSMPFGARASASLAAHLGKVGGWA